MYGLLGLLPTVNSPSRKIFTEKDVYVFYGSMYFTNFMIIEAQHRNTPTAYKSITDQMCFKANAYLKFQHCSLWPQWDVKREVEVVK